MKSLAFSMLLAACAALPAQAVSPVFPRLDFQDAQGDPTAVTVTAGQSFSFQVLLNTPQSVTGLSYFLTNSAGDFTITSRSANGSVFPDLTTADTDVAGHGIDPTVDLGGLVSDLNSPLGPNSYTVADYTLSTSASLAPGVYVLSFVTPDSVVSGPGPNFAETPVISGEYQVTVLPTPEPSALALFGLGAGLLGLTAFRRARK